MPKVKIQNYFNPNIRTYVFVFAIALIAISYYLKNKPPGDFANYYFGSKFFFNGRPTNDIYDPATFNNLITKEGMQKVYADYAPVPPFSLLFFSPFIFSDIQTSKLIFNILSSLFFSFSLYRFFNLLRIKPNIVLLLLAIIALPVKNNIQLGQTYLLVACFLMEGYMFSIKQNRVASSLFFAIPIALKIFPAIILLWLFFTNRRKEFLTTILFAIILFGVVIPFSGIDLVKNYIAETLPRLLNGEINDPFAAVYQSFTVLLRKLLVYDSILNPGAEFHSPLLFNILNTLFSALILTACIYIIKKEKHSDIFSFGFTLFCGMLISGYGTNYGLVLLLFIASASIYYKPRKNTFFIVLIAITIFPSHLISGIPLVLQFGRFYFMLLLFIILVKDRQIKLFTWNYALIASILFLPVIYRLTQKQDDSVNYLSKEPSLLLFDYKQIPGGIMVYFINKNGTDSIFHKTTDRLLKSDKLSIQNKQVYYNNIQITAGNDQKKHATLLNNDKILYLSDKGRGVGLFGLRRIDIHQ